MNKRNALKTLLMAVIYSVCASFLMASATGCSTTKKVENVAAKTHEVSNENADSAYMKDSQILSFGDTLKGTGFLPASSNGIDSTSTDSVETESAGIKLKIKVTPIKNKKGKFIGNKVDYNAIAKPTAKQTTHEVHAASVSTQKTVDLKLNAKSTTETKKGFSVPSWVWWLLILIVLLFVVLIYFTYKNTFIAWIKRLL